MANGDFGGPFWSLAADQAERWRQAANAVLNGTYTTDAFLNDALYPWALGWAVWWGSFGLKPAFLTMNQGDDAASTVVPVVAPGTENPASSGLTTATKTIPQANVGAQLQNGRRELRVAVQGLNALPAADRPADGDVFRGIVTIGDRLIVPVILRVDPAPP